MTLYKRRPGQPLKWLIGLIVFGLAMGITFADVYGYGGDGTNSVSDGSVGPSGGTYGDDNNLGTSNEDPSAVPEPTTLILLAGGLSALYAARNRNKKK